MNILKLEMKAGEEFGKPTMEWRFSFHYTVMKYKTSGIYI